MTTAEKLLKRCEFDKGLYAHIEERYGAREENARLLPIITALIEDRERLREALDEVTRCICDKAYKIRDMRDLVAKCEGLVFDKNTFTVLELGDLYDRARKLLENK